MSSSSPESLLKSALADAAARTDVFLRDYLASLPDSPPKLSESIAYSLFGPGKRIRPALVILSAQALGGPPPSPPEAALPAAAAIEMIHCFSLIHDDLPAMDNDDLRRGRPTNHKVFGDALAILAGDALNTMAFEVLARSIKDSTLAARLILELATATGCMIGGQVLDTCHPEEAKSGAKPTLAGLQQIHRMKTGALLRCSCRMGALAAGASDAQLELLDAYGRAIGLAFQIMDDILDVTSTAEQMGKATGKDAAIGKLTYPSLIGLDAARQHLATQVALTDEICTHLGPPAATLRALSHYMAERTS